MTSSLLSRTIFIFTAVSALGASELSFLDLRLGGGILSNNFEGSSSITVNNGSSNVTTGSDGRDSDRNYRGQLQLVWGNLGPAGGLILGVGAAVNQARFDGTPDIDVTTPVVDVLIGYGMAVNPQWHFELTPFAGIGRSYYTVKNQGNSSTSHDWDKYYEYGAKIGTYYTFAERGAQIGLEVPYLVGRFDADFDHSNNGNTVNVTDSSRSQGFGVEVTLGYRF